MHFGSLSRSTATVSCACGTVKLIFHDPRLRTRADCCCNDCERAFNWADKNKRTALPVSTTVQEAGARAAAATGGPRGATSPRAPGTGAKKAHPRVKDLYYFTNDLTVAAGQDRLKPVNPVNTDPFNITTCRI